VLPDQASDPAEFAQTYGGYDNDLAITPTTLGFVATGQSMSYKAWAIKTISGTLVYSGSPATHTQVFPNDGLYYTVGLEISPVSGALYKVQKVGTGYLIRSGTSVQDDTSQAWDASSTVTPTTGPVSAAVFDRSATTSISQVSHVVLRNTSGSDYGALIDFQAKQGTTYTSVGKIGSTTAGDLTIAPSGNIGSGRVFFGPVTAPYVRLGPTQTVFNLQTTNYEWMVRGPHTPYLLYINTNGSRDGVIVGSSGTANDYAALLNIAQTGTRQGVTVSAGGGSDTSEAFMVQVGTSKKFGVDLLGRAIIGGNGQPTNSMLTVAPGDNATTQITLQNCAQLPTTPVAGGIERYDNNGWTTSSNAIQSQLLFTDKNNHRYPILTAQIPSTVNRVWYSDSNGMPTTTTDLQVDATSHVIIVGASAVLEIKGQLVVDSGKDIQMNGGTLSGQFRTSYVPFSTNTSGGAAHVYNMTGSTSRTFTLPNAVNSEGTEYVVHCSGTSGAIVTINTTSGQTIDGAASGAITYGAGKSRTFVSNGSNWIITGGVF
jgi:hypothetical protein